MSGKSKCETDEATSDRDEIDDSLISYLSLSAKQKAAAIDWRSDAALAAFMVDTGVECGDATACGACAQRHETSQLCVGSARPTRSSDLPRARCRIYAPATPSLAISCLQAMSEYEQIPRGLFCSSTWTGATRSPRRMRAVLSRCDDPIDRCMCRLKHENGRRDDDYIVRKWEAGAMQVSPSPIPPLA